MLKAIVVDDEPRVRRGLSSLIPELDPDWIVAGTAANGIEALELVRKEMPDLVITDIRMPHMNGLDLLSELNGYPAHVVILSGYGYFEYAQTALKFGAYDYLLKPVKPDDISNLLERVKNQRSENTVSPRTIPHAVNCARWWKDWLTEEEESAPFIDKLREQLEDAEGAIRVIAIEIDRFDELLSEDQWGDKQLLLFAVRNVAQEMLSAETGRASSYLFTSGSQLYFATTGDCSGTELGTRLIEQIKQSVKISVSIGISASDQPFERMPDSYRQAKEALRNKWIYGDGIVSDYCEVNLKIREEFGYPADLDEAVVRAVRNGELQHALDGITAFMHRMKEDNLPFRLFRRFCLQLLSSVFRIMYEQRLNEVVRSRLDQPQELFHRDFTAQEFMNYMNDLVTLTIEAMDWSKLERHNRTIDRALTFMKANYAKDISLDDVALHVGMSSNYFSSFFKQETGETFVERLTAIRVDKAKSLMMNAQLRMYEIAEMVGYADVKYFSRLFKRNVGVTPVEYRQFFYRGEV